jgi:hypothetical protein
MDENPTPVGGSDCRHIKLEINNAAAEDRQSISSFAYNISHQLYA